MLLWARLHQGYSDSSGIFRCNGTDDSGGFDCLRARPMKTGKDRFRR
jgi:hypothetical protein